LTHTSEQTRYSIFRFVLRKKSQNELDEIIILHARFEFMTTLTVTKMAPIVRVQAVLI